MNLEVAHIWPRSHQGLYLPSNGIALCRDMHCAFDKGMFTIDDNLKVIVHPDVDSEYLKKYDRNVNLYLFLKTVSSDRILIIHIIIKITYTAYLKLWVH